MSVILFSVDTFARIGRVLLNNEKWGDSLGELTQELAKDLARVAHANSACFRHRYGHRPEAAHSPISAEEIESAIASELASGAYDLDGAIDDACMLQYNCQEDRDFLVEEPGAQASLIWILGALLRAKRDAHRVGRRHGT